MPRLTRDREVAYELNRRRIKNAIRRARWTTGPLAAVVIPRVFAAGRQLIGGNPAITEAELLAGLTAFITSHR